MVELNQNELMDVNGGGNLENSAIGGFIGKIFGAGVGGFVAGPVGASVGGFIGSSAGGYIGSKASTVNPPYQGKADRWH